MNFDSFTDAQFAAYVAGFTDGEGNITVDEQGHIRITLANCVNEVLEAIQQRLGYGIIRSQKLREHWQRRYTLIFDDALECERFANLVYPYLHIKRDDADRLLARVAEWRAIIAAVAERNRLIREALDAKIEPQKDIAARFGVSPQTISRIKRGEQLPPLTILTGRTLRHPSLDRFLPPSKVEGDTS